MSNKNKITRVEEIETSLKQDKTLLSFITDALERNAQLHMKMDSVFFSLYGKLESMENKIMPMYEESQRLKQLDLKTDLTLAELDSVISHYNIRETTAWIISQGPTGRLKNYLDCLDQIKRAMEYFEEVIPEGPELKALRQTKNSAKAQLLCEFKRLLLRCSNPASPTDILNLIDEEEVLGTQKEDVGIPSNLLQDMVPISTWFVEDCSSFDCWLEDIDEADEAFMWKGVKKLKTRSLDRDTCRSPHKKRTASWLTNKLKTRSLDRPSNLGPLPRRKEDSKLRELPDIIEEESPLTLASNQSRRKTRSLDRLESPNTFKAPFPGSPFTRKTVSWVIGKKKTRSLERHPGFEPVHGLFSGRPQRVVNIFTTYSKARSCRLHRSLKDFKGHLRKTSVSFTSLHSLSSSSSSSSYSSSSSSLSSFRGSLARIFKRLGKEGWSDINIDCYSQCLKAFSLLASVEFSALARVFPQIHWKKTFDPLVQEALDVLIEEGEYIVFAVRHAVNAYHVYDALLTLLRALYTLKAAQPSINKVLEYTTNETKDKLPNLIESMGAFAQQALDKYPGRIMLVQLKSTAELFQVPASREPGSETPDDITCLRPFISEVLEQIFLSLENMATTYDDPSLRAIFLFNNYNFIHKSILRAQLRGLWEEGADAPQAVWESRTEEQKQKYLQSWLAVIEYLKDEGIPPVQPGSELKEKECRLIKGKFKSFNDSLEELLRAQREWAIPDPDQREALSRGQVYVVGQAYRAFLQRYEQVNFTRHPQKYNQYSPEELDEMIERFFDTLI
ncbi:exocyst complex component 7-like isoform X3 [Alosa sapidissima]|uniref:exocyst complex component 7-like isoform X3 n=1 Tax=Alosa sapidissima TaxID=34773 RepID=UPI001C08B7A5|nr:exocyst complex component 7-like isoform X3 [Alosa sapidissima]